MNKTIFERSKDETHPISVFIIFDDGTVDVINEISEIHFKAGNHENGISVLGNYHAFAIGLNR